MWDPPRPGIELVCPILEGWFFTTEPPGKPHLFFCLFVFNSVCKIYKRENSLVVQWLRLSPFIPWTGVPSLVMELHGSMPVWWHSQNKSIQKLQRGEKRTTVYLPFSLRNLKKEKGKKILPIHLNVPVTSSPVTAFLQPIFYAPEFGISHSCAFVFIDALCLSRYIDKEILIYIAKQCILLVCINLFMLYINE